MENNTTTPQTTASTVQPDPVPKEDHTGLYLGIGFGAVVALIFLWVFKLAVFVFLVCGGLTAGGWALALYAFGNAGAASMIAWIGGTITVCFTGLAFKAAMDH